MLRRDRISREAAGGVSGGTLRGGGIELRPDAREVRREGEVVRLRPKEFDLLECLMRHPRQVLTRDRILEQVWGNEFGGGTRTVDVHMRWLRQKLEAAPSKPQHLVTVRTVGYKFVP